MRHVDIRGVGQTKDTGLVPFQMGLLDDCRRCRHGRRVEKI